MRTYAQALQAGLRLLQDAQITTPQLDAMILLEHVTGVNRAHLVAHPEHHLPARLSRRFQKLLGQRAAHQPLAYLVGYKEFYGLRLKVTPSVLIPRPETEDMVDYLLDKQLKNIYFNIYFPKIKSLRVLDVGTGSGAIAIALAHHRPGWQITATDISTAALAIARANARAHHVKVSFRQSDLLASVAGSFRLICANLPYVRSDIKISADARAEPSLAIVGGPDGLDYYRRFLPTVGSILQPHGLLLIEAMPDQHPELTRLAADSGLSLLDDRRLILVFQK
ncbi:peptide chain release factor N(5)-glutamine methyltransferase [Candidatus Microgenomates bacterium]|nr:peptide chain release factor N(5)-glutamine methyltransferase [Candidatus Microgenomates bacterium]